MVRIGIGEKRIRIICTVSALALNSLFIYDNFLLDFNTILPGWGAK